MNDFGTIKTLIELVVIIGAGGMGVQRILSGQKAIQDAISDVILPRIKALEDDVKDIKRKLTVHHRHTDVASNP